MCLLCFVPPKKWPKKKHLKNACDSNPDGFGFAINTGSEIITRKSMNANELIEEFYDLRNDNKDCAALFHARLATHGTKALDNCHPFNVCFDENIVMAHNGILPVLLDKDKVRSDTKVFAEDYMYKLGIESLDDEIGNDIISEYANGSKLVFLNASNKLQKEWYIINEKSGVYEKDIWYSNSGYQEPKNIFRYMPYRSKFYDNIKSQPSDDYYEDDDACSMCYQSFDNLPDCKYMNGCNQCGLTSAEIWEIYDSVLTEQDMDQRAYYNNVHRKPLSRDWKKQGV